MELMDIMNEAEACIDGFQNGEIGEDEYLASEGGGQIEIAGRPCEAVWLVVCNSRLPEIRIRNGENVYTVEMKRTVCPEVVLYEWQCWDDFGIARAIDEVCAERGRVVFA